MSNVFSNLDERLGLDATFFHNAMYKGSETRYVDSVEMSIRLWLERVGEQWLSGEIKVFGLAGDSVREGVIADYVFEHLREKFLEYTSYVITTANIVERSKTGFRFSLEFADTKLSRTGLLENVARNNQATSARFSVADDDWITQVREVWQALIKKTLFHEPNTQSIHGQNFVTHNPFGTHDVLEVSERYDWVRGIQVRLVELTEDGAFTLLCEILKAPNFDNASNVYWRKARNAAIVEIRDIIHALVKDMTTEDGGWTTLLCLDVDEESQHYSPDRVGIEVIVR